MYKSKLLYKKRPLTINPDLAIAIGLNEAIVLQQVQYWCEYNEENRKNFRDGHFWVYNSFPEWQKQFPWWCEKTVKTIFSKLEKRNLLITANYNRLSMDRTKWYRVNHEALDAVADSSSGKNYPMDRVNNTRPIPENKQRENKNGSFAPQAAKRTRFDSVISGTDDIKLYAFIEWYYTLYKEMREEEHPRIKQPQERRVIEELTNFLSNPEFAGVDADGLQAMARDFFYTADSNDWRINHFATPGILENRFYNVYRH